MSNSPGPLGGFIDRRSVLATAEGVLAGQFSHKKGMLVLGVPGIGKTATLRAIRAKAESMGRRVAWLDVKRYFPVSAIGSADRENIISSVVDEILHQLRPSPSWPNSHDPEVGLNQPTSSMSDFLDALAERNSQPIALFLDNIEDCHPLIWLRIQSDILAPVLGAEHHTFFLARQMRFNQSTTDLLVAAIQATTETVSLMPFSSQATKLQINAIAPDSQFDVGTVMRATGGIPKLNKAIALAIADGIDPDSWLDTAVHSLFTDSSSLDTRFSASVQRRLLLTSIFRVFNEDTLQALRDEFWPNQIGSEIAMNERQSLIRELKRTRLVQTCNDGRDGYCIVAPVRGIIEAYFARTNPEHYFRVLHKATIWIRARLMPGNFYAVTDTVQYMSKLFQFLRTHPAYASLLPPELLPLPNEGARLSLELETVLLQARRLGQHISIAHEVSRSLDSKEFANIPARHRMMDIAEGILAV